MELQYLFRKPAYPVVALIEGHFVGAKTQKALAGQLARIPFENEKSYDMVDSKGEGWSLYTSHMLISPLTTKKRWTKKEIVEMFNKRGNLELAGGKMYPVKSLSAKRLDRIISDLAEMST